MGVNRGFSAFQVALAVAGDANAQRVQTQNVAPGTGNPQISGVTIRAMKGNTGIIYLGGSQAEAAAAIGFELAAGDALSVDIEGLGNLWMSGTKAADRLCIAGVGP